MKFRGLDYKCYLLQRRKGSGLSAVIGSYLAFLVCLGGVGKFNLKDLLALVCFPIYIPDNMEYWGFHRKYFVTCNYVSATEIKQLDQRDPLG